MQVIRALALVAALAGAAHAEDDTSEAQQLFAEGRALLDAGKTDAACEKFEQSIAKDPRAVGTLLNLGLCNERRGKVATALKLFQEAFDRAGEADLTEHQNAAKQHITQLVPLVPVVVVKIAAPVAGESIFLDDVGVKDRRELQLDPGPHKLVATAPGRLPFEKSFPLAAAQRITIDVPQLEVPKATTTIVRESSARRLIGKIATVSGAGLLVGGAALVIYGKRSYDRQFTNGNCQLIDEERLCNDVGQDQASRARNVAAGGLVIGAIGGVALATGLVLWLTAPSDTTSIAPSISAEGGGVVFTRRF